MTHPLVDNHFAQNVRAQRALDVGSRGESTAAQVQLVVGRHGHEREDLQRAVEKGGAKQVVDAQWAAGGGARRVARGVGEELPELGILEYAAVAVVGDSYLVCLFDVGGTRVVAADPGRQSSPCVGSDRQRGPVQGPERLVFPVHVPAPVRAEEGVGYSELEHGELGARLQVDGFPEMSISKLASSPAVRFLESTYMEQLILFLRCQKLRPVDLSEASLICRTRSG